MSIYAFIGPSGAGKSFLVKQLSALTSSPAFFEGEIGSIDNDILESIENATNPYKRYKYFCDRFSNSLTAAHKISISTKLDIFIDGSFENELVILESEKPTNYLQIKKMILQVTEKTPKADYVVYLRVSETRLLSNIKRRSRSKGEIPDDCVLNRKKSFEDFVSKTPYIKVIDVDKINFTHPENLDLIIKKLKNFSI
ncbi:MAG: deoxynucleoside kinase [bacterium]|nr:deoxynucleoside kinase [bacterium]